MEKIILLVDQNDHDVELFQRAADKSCDAEVRRVASGHEAVDYLSGNGSYGDRRRHPLPTLIIVELDLPSADGFSVLRFTQKDPRLKVIPVVILTSNYSPDQLDSAKQLGAEAIFIKPETEDELEKLVTALCEVYIHFALPPALAHPELV